MNIQPGNMTGVRRRSTLPAMRAEHSHWGTIARVVIIVITLAAVGNMHIYLQQKTSECNKKVRELKREITEVTNENTLLRNRREALSDWRHINAQIARFNLKLHSANPGQVRPIQIYSPRQAAAIQWRPAAVTASRY